MAVSSWQMALW